MNTKLTAIALLLASNAAFAASFNGTAEVVDVHPAFAEVHHSVQVCDAEQPSYQQPASNSPAGALIGGVLGGIAGHQVGRGRGNTAATIAGALGGAYVGNKIGSAENPGYGGAPQSCHMEDRVQRQPQGYRVTYRFAGRTFTDTLPYDPGDQVRVHVSVSPAR